MSTMIEQARAATPPELAWPRKADVLGVQVSITNYDEAVEAIVRAARLGHPATVSCHAVHAIVTCSSDPQLRAAVNSFQMITPDGQPVRWALNLLHRARLKKRVYGPELMMCLCRAAATEGLPVYLYGGSEDVALRLPECLRQQFPGLVIAGSESPPYRPITAEEAEAVDQRIRASGARLVFIGLGCPKQDQFAFEHHGHFPAVQICVGAAFDFLCGNKPMAPSWMQRFGLEWVFRLCQEPRRLWQRYLVTNTKFVLGVVAALFRHAV